MIHQENRGLSGARNTALDVMTGDLVMFLDSDDAYHPEMIRKMVEALEREQTEMALCKYSNYQTTYRMDIKKQKKRFFPSAPQGHYNREKALYAAADGLLSAVVWNKIYCRSLWEHIRFPEGHVYEDIVTNYQILNRISDIYVVDEVLYFRRIHPGSITATTSEKNIRDRILAFSMREKYIREYIPEVLSADHFCRMECSKFEALMDMYFRFCPEKTEEKQFAEELRHRIMEISTTIGLRRCRIHVRVFYLLVYFCPWLIRMIYPVYLIIRNNVNSILYQKSAP